MQTLLGLAHHGCQPPIEAAGPCLSYRKAPGTLHYHTMFSDWEIVPWAHCTEPASPQNWCCFIWLPKLSWATGQDHHAPSASSICECGSAHTSHRTDGGNGIVSYGPQSSTAGIPGDAIGESRTASLGDTG